MSKSTDISKLLAESTGILSNPGFEAYCEFVFRDYVKKYNDFISKGGAGISPKLLPILKKNYDKFIGYDSTNFKYNLKEVIDMYKKYRIDELEAKHKDKDIDRKEKAINMGLSYYGIDTL